MTSGSPIGRELRIKAYILAKIAAFSALPKRLLPGTAAALDYAKRRWKHSYVRERIRSRNPFEREVMVESVTMWDDYGVASEAFAPDDVVVDIGAHVGEFTLPCHQLGARRILANEPEREYFRLLAHRKYTSRSIASTNISFREYQLKDLVTRLELFGFCVTAKPVTRYLGYFNATGAEPSRMAFREGSVGRNAEN